MISRRLKEMRDAIPHHVTYWYATTKIPSGRFSGDIGERRTTVYTDGKVFLAGEEWDAISQSLISAGQRVRVVRMILEVEKE